MTKAVSPRKQKEGAVHTGNKGKEIVSAENNIENKKQNRDLKAGSLERHMNYVN